MRIYTKTGDDGETGVVGGQRVSKDDARIEAYGTVDELNAALGLIRSNSPRPELDELLAETQRNLFTLGSELATPADSQSWTPSITEQHLEQLEKWIDHWEANLPELRNFILPGGTPIAAHLHLARVICRRAERRVVTLARLCPISQVVIPFLNRLSDLFFVLARAENAQQGVSDPIWQPDDKSC